jgi:hypothetical protein
MRTVPLAISLTALLLGSSNALAYPTAVIFAPNGDAKALGDVSAFVYTSSLKIPKLPLTAGTTWVGMEIGVLPSFEYGSSGLSFGGLEVGADLLSQDLAGTADAYIKPLFSAKLSLLAESEVLPSVGVGIMDVAPGKWERSLSFAFGSMSKTLQFGDMSLGRLTLGLGGSLGDFDDDPYKDTLSNFYGTAPFSKGARAALLGGYESPMFGPFYFAVDHIGGYSEVSSTNVALLFTPSEGAYLAVGSYFGSDPDNWYWGMLAFASLNFSLSKYFGGEPPPEAAPAPAAPPAAAPAAPPAAAPAAPPAAPAVEPAVGAQPVAPTAAPAAPDPAAPPSP